MNGLLQSRVLRSEMDMRERARVATAEAQYSFSFPYASLHPGREAAYPDPTWQELYNAALVEFDLARLPERVEATCQAIHKHRVQKGHTLTAEERKALGRCFASAGHVDAESRVVCCICYNPRPRRTHGHNRAVEG